TIPCLYQSYSFLLVLQSYLTTTIFPYTTLFRSKYEKETVPRTLAPFSSKGPVSVNWMMKPDVIAPGVNILSTVPEGYEVLNGTSMAAPHVTGAAAVLKEAHPDWDASQIINALKTSAKKLDDADPVEQGAGTDQIEE